MIASLLWGIFGVIGGFICWRFFINERLFDNEHYAQHWCPTPRALVIITCIAIFGPLTLIAGVCLLIIQQIVFRIVNYKRYPHPRSWWTTPICDL